MKRHDEVHMVAVRQTLLYRFETDGQVVRELGENLYYLRVILGVELGIVVVCKIQKIGVTHGAIGGITY
jgi:hypothetical protein